MTKASIVAVCVKVGDEVKTGDLLFQAETDKAVIDVESEYAGTVAAVIAEEGDEFPVGATVLTIGLAGKADNMSGKSGDAPASEFADGSPAQGHLKDEFADGLQAQGRLEGESADGLQIQAQEHAMGGREERRSERRIPASPLARKIAKENGIDLALVRAAGRVIEKGDILEYLAQVRKAHEGSQAAGCEDAPFAFNADGKTRVERNKAKTIAAERLSWSFRQAPHFYLTRDVDMTAVLAEIETLKCEVGPVQGVDQPAMCEEETISHGGQLTRCGDQPFRCEEPLIRNGDQPAGCEEPFIRNGDQLAGCEEPLIRCEDQPIGQERRSISMNDCLVWAAACALRNEPMANAAFYDGNIWLNPSVNIGYAVAAPKGLVVPVIHHADQMNVAAISEQRRLLVARALENTLQPADIEEGTFTISNLGAFGIDHFQAIVNPPEAAILAVGRLRDHVKIVSGEVRSVPVCTLTLSVDHRVLDGSEAARFFEILIYSLENIGDVRRTAGG